MMPKKNKGSALIVVIMVMVVMMILGTTILNISLFENRMSKRENNRMQAYYLAKMGAQAVLVQIANGKNIDAGTSNTVYLQDDDNFGTKNIGSKGSFSVTVDKLGDKNYNITSNAQAGGVANKVVVEVKRQDIGKNASAMDVGWMNNGNGGQLLKKGPASDQSGNIIFFRETKELKVEKTVADSFVADYIVFNVGFQHDHTDINLRAKGVMFMENFDNVDANIVLNVLGTGITGPSSTYSKWGLVYVNGGWYYFGDGQRLSEVSKPYTGDITDLMKITHSVVWSDN